MIVVDASLMVEALTDDAVVGAQSRLILADDPHWLAPEHFRAEVASAIRGCMLGGQISEERAEAAVHTLSRLQIAVESWNGYFERVWELRHNLTPYDAAYIALAECRGCRVVTCDAKLERCQARKCPVEVVAPL